MAAEEDDLVDSEPDYEFVEREWEEDLVCFVCAYPFVSPKTHNPCGHSFCLRCLKKMAYSCPMCRQDPGKDSFSPVKQRFVLNMLGKVQVRCRLCEEVCAISDFENHQKRCEGVVVDCPGKDLGCLFLAKKKNMDVHVLKCEKAKIFPVLGGFLDRFKALEGRVEELEKQNERLGKIVKENPMGTGIGWVHVGEEMEAEVCEVMSGIFCIRCEFSLDVEEGGGLSVDLTFLVSPVGTARLPFEGSVSISLLYPGSLSPFKTVTVSTYDDLEFEENTQVLPSIPHNFGEVATLEEMVNSVGEDRKLWFRVKVEPFIEGEEEEEDDDEEEDEEDEEDEEEDEEDEEEDDEEELPPWDPSIGFFMTRRGRR